jgi:hypothetical protein
MPAELIEVMRRQRELRVAEGWGRNALVFPREGGGHLRQFDGTWAVLRCGNG